MAEFDITVPKPPDDVWALEVDFTERLDTAGGEQLNAASCTVYKLWGYDQIVEEYNLEQTLRLNIELERLGGTTLRYSYPITTQPSAELRVPTDYNATPVLGIVPPESIIIGPAAGTPPNTKVSFHVQGGEDRTRYAVLVTVTTTAGRQHSCVLRFRVAELELTG